MSEPEPRVPGEYDLLDKAHTILRQRLMVQVQSTWFPLIDRNPQRFVDVHRAVDGDFQRATHRVFRSWELPTHL